MVGNPQDDRIIGQPALLQRVQDRGDVLVHHRVEIRVEVDIVRLRLRAIQWRELVVGIAGHFLDLRFGRQIVGVVRRQLDAEVGEVVAPVTGLLPCWRLHVAPWVDADIVRVHQRYEHAERLVPLRCTLFQEFNDALATDAGCLAMALRIEPADVTSIIVGERAAQSAHSVDLAERRAFPLLDRIAGVGWIPAGPTPVLLHDADVGRSPVLAAIADHRVGRVAQVPLALPNDVVAGFLLQEGADVRLPILMRQTGPEERAGHTVHRGEAACQHESAGWRALAGRGVGTLEVQTIALEPLQRGQVHLCPTIRPMDVVALLIGHQNYDVRRLRHSDGVARHGGCGEAVRYAGCGGSEPNACTQQLPPARGGGHFGCVAARRVGHVMIVLLANGCLQSR